MGKIINSFLYGSSKTKAYLWGMLALALTALVFIGLAAALGSIAMMLFAVFFIGFDVYLFQSVSFKDTIKEGEEEAEKQKQQKKRERARKHQALQQQKRKTGEELIAELQMEELSAPGRKDSPKEKEEKRNPSLKKYDQKSIKQMMVKYKVKKEHRKVIIDSSDRFDIYQCPAYAWKDRREAYFLLLEKEPRIVRIPIDKIRGIGYQRMVEAKPVSDYQNFMEPCLVTKLFSEYLPNYKEGSYRGKMGAFKNLYTVIPDIRFTNTSARNLLDILEVEFAPVDEITESTMYSEYYKTAYRASILWKDGVITTVEYKDRIKNLLTYVASEPISRQIYEDLLRQLVEHKLITSDYAEYYRKLKG